MNIIRKILKYANYFNFRQVKFLHFTTIACTCLKLRNSVILSNFLCNQKYSNTRHSLLNSRASLGFCPVIPLLFLY
jgi:hypothetical protein